MYEFEPYRNPTLWAAHASLLRQHSVAAARRPWVCLSAGVRRWLRRQRIEALMRAVMSGTYMRQRGDGHDRA